jgi:oligosaccharyl transferase complex subunit OST4
MISDDDLYRLAVLLGSSAIVLIVIYHFFEVNATSQPEKKTEKAGKNAAQTTTASTKSR